MHVQKDYPHRNLLEELPGPGHQCVKTFCRGGQRILKLGHLKLEAALEKRLSQHVTCVYI